MQENGFWDDIKRAEEVTRESKGINPHSKTAGSSVWRNQNWGRAGNASCRTHVGEQQNYFKN